MFLIRLLLVRVVACNLLVIRVIVRRRFEWIIRLLYLRTLCSSALGTIPTRLLTNNGLAMQLFWRSLYDLRLGTKAFLHVRPSSREF